MANLTHEFLFEFILDVSSDKLEYKKYSIAKDDDPHNEKEVNPKEPPSIFNHVVFDILRKYAGDDGGVVNLTSHMAYLFVDEPDELDVICFDVIEVDRILRNGQDIECIPARYETSHGSNGTRKSRQKPFFLGDVYDCLISHDWDTDGEISLKRTRGRCNKWWHNAGYIITECSVTKNKEEFTFTGSFTLQRHLLGEVAGAIPIPRLKNDHCFPAHHIIVAHYDRKNKNKAGKNELDMYLSGAASSNLEDLSQLLQYREPRVTWIMGDPGSGKEIFAQAIHYGSTQSRKGVLESRSTAGVTLAELNKRLFLSKPNEDCLISRINYGTEEKDGEDGYQAGGTIFLDEFDKLAEPRDIYGSMLRVLEAKEYIQITDQPGASPSEEIQTCKQVNWLFAGAFSQSDPKDIVPPDLWSRLTGFISIRNPLLNNAGYAATLFIFFYIREVLDMVPPDHPGDKDCKSEREHFIDALEKKHKDWGFKCRVIAKLLGMEKNIEEDEILKPSKSLLDFAFRFSEYANLVQIFRSDRIDSSRAIRQATRIAFSSVRNQAIEKEEKFVLDQDSMSVALKAAARSLMIARGPY
ncbi:MAG: sigma 54-interacting transcriptional regulator [Candidatus Thiodiazotropha sp.]